MITLKQNSRMRGLFMIERQQHNPDGSPIPGTKEVVAPWQDNLLLDSGLDNMSGNNWMTRCHLGSGSATPAPGDTALVASLGSVNNSNVAITPGPSTEDYSSVVSSWVFPPGTATGIIAELGVGPNAGNLTTRALVRDENGAPTTITKGPIDSLTVTYQIREYPDKGDSIYQVTNPHTSQTYDVVSRTAGGTGGDRLSRWHGEGPIIAGTSGAHRFHAANSALTPWDGAYVTGLEDSGRVVASYTAGNHYLDVVCTWDESRGNVSGGITRIGASSFYQTFRIQASFDPPIDKDNSKTLQITLRKSWGRYVP